MHTVMTEVMLTAAIATIAAFLAASFYSSMTSFYNVYRTAIGAEEEKALMDIKIVFATNTSSTTVKVWIKNVGQKPLSKNLITRASLIFGPSSQCELISYNSSTPPSWTFQLAYDADGDGVWDPSETIELTITWSETLAPGDYYVKFIMHNGVSDDYYFSI